jgi:hypothetical protein
MVRRGSILARRPRFFWFVGYDSLSEQTKAAMEEEQSISGGGLLWDNPPKALAVSRCGLEIVVVLIGRDDDMRCTQRLFPHGAVSEQLRFIRV